MKYATDNGFPNPTFFIDDGVSGVTFDRPSWNEMIRLVEAGKVTTVIVKDMSRMGRDYLKVGYYAMAFEEAARKQRFQEAEKEAKKRRREIAQAEKRIAELDRIFKCIYEDDISGAISHERFLKLSADYEAEQKELTEKVKAWRDAVETFEQDQADFASFAAIVRKYVGIRELTPTIVNEFVKKVIVHAPDKSSGHRRQKIELVWNFIGEVKLPGDHQMVERQRKGRTA